MVQNIQNIKKGWLINENCLAFANDKNDLIMEGSGENGFEDEGMEIYFPVGKYHHVIWCPVDFLGSFIAEWEVKNLCQEACLCMIFYSSKGNMSESILDTTFPKKVGIFSQYTKSKYFSNYHISYYANEMGNPGYEISDLRKNLRFELLGRRN